MIEEVAAPEEAPTGTIAYKAKFGGRLNTITDPQNGLWMRMVRSRGHGLARINLDLSDISKTERYNRFAQKRIFEAINVLAQIADRRLNWFIDPTTKGSSKSLCKFLMTKMRIKRRQAQRYISTLKYCGVIEEMATYYGNHGKIGTTYKFSKDFAKKYLDWNKCHISVQ